MAAMALAIGYFALDKFVLSARDVADDSAATMPARTGRTSIAVLPFDNLSGDPTQEYFSDGMTEEVIGKLASVQGLRVISRTTVEHHKNSGMSIPDIARELNVGFVLEGSVRKSGDMVRIAVQLVRASDGFSAWSGRFDRQLDDIFTAQDDIAGMITQTLTPRVAKTAGPLVTSTTSHSEAYSLFLEGRYLWNKRPGDVVWQALDRFERAIAVDPHFAPAYAALASVYGTLGAWELGLLPPAEALAKGTTLVKPMPRARSSACSEGRSTRSVNPAACSVRQKRLPGRAKWQPTTAEYRLGLIPQNSTRSSGAIRSGTRRPRAAAS